MDLSKLSPTPWVVLYPGHSIVLEQAGGVHVAWFQTDDGPSLNRAEHEANANFCALARNAFEVMMRRQWNPIPQVDKTWGIQNYETTYPKGLGGMGWPDPFTALVEADKYYRETLGR
ncbi:MAG TPA: hypothetical protein VEI97_06620 [bacterium]|nr:hypothetical protein [bacterium]